MSTCDINFSIATYLGSSVKLAQTNRLAACELLELGREEMIFPGFNTRHYSCSIEMNSPFFQFNPWW